MRNMRGRNYYNVGLHNCLQRVTVTTSCRELEFSTISGRRHITVIPRLPSSCVTLFWNGTPDQNRSPRLLNFWRRLLPQLDSERELQQHQPATPPFVDWLFVRRLQNRFDGQ